MKPYIYMHVKKLGISFGWFSGEEFTIFGIELFRRWQKGDGWTIVSVQVAKFLIMLTIG